MKKWLYYFLFLLLPLLASISISKDANAFELTHGSTRNALETSYIYMGENEGSGGHQFLGQFNGKNDLSFYNLPANKYVTTLHLDFSSVIQPNSLFTFTVYYRVKGGPWSYSVGIDYYGLSSGSSWTLLNESCTPGNEETLVATNTYEKTLTCTYVGFTNVVLDHIDTISNSYIVRLNNGGATAGWADGSGEIVVGYIDSRLISFNGLTEDDREWLETVLENSSDVGSVVSKLNEVKAEQQNTTNAVREQTRQQHEDYENEVDREEAKEDELNDQKDDLSISAQNTGNPFASLFNATGCQSMPTVGGWFGRSDLQICSPYPSQIGGVIRFVGSSIVVGLLIRLYYKKLKGGVDG